MNTLPNTWYVRLMIVLYIIAVTTTSVIAIYFGFIFSRPSQIDPLLSTIVCDNTNAILKFQTFEIESVYIPTEKVNDIRKTCLITEGKTNIDALIEVAEDRSAGLYTVKQVYIERSPRETFLSILKFLVPSLLLLELLRRTFLYITLGKKISKTNK